jgi:hypothetical protein
MPSDIEMGDSDSPILDTEITLDPEIIADQACAGMSGIRNIFAVPGFAPLRRLR